MAPTSRGKTCLLATNQSKLEKAQADYDQACKAYSELQQLLFDAAKERPRDEVQVQILQTALANAEKDKDFARKMLEVEMKKTPQSEASEVAKKCLLFQLLTGCVVFLYETYSNFWIERHGVVNVLASSAH